jgi:MFS family permease
MNTSGKNNSPVAHADTAGRMRHRDRLLSLKRSTIEACFSVPMLNLTMPNLPFAIAFAATALGWRPWAIGLMAALPHCCNFAQPPITALLQRRFSLHHTMRVSFAMSALPWVFVGFLPFLGPRRDWLFGAALVVATLSNSVASVAWSSAIAEVVPPRISGKFFGRRNLIFGFWTLLVVLLAGRLVESGPDRLLMFSWIFIAAGVARFMGLFFLTRMKFPVNVLERQNDPMGWEEFRAVFRDRNYLLLAAFIGCWGLLLNMGLPFYTFYLVNELQVSVTTVVKLTTVASLGGLVTLRAWGALCDRFGNRPVLKVCAILWSLAGLICWSVAGPRWNAHLYACYFLVGATTAGLQLCQFNLMVTLAPPGKRAPHITVFLAVTSLLTAFGPVLGSLLLTAIPKRLGTLFGQPLQNYHLLFAVSFIGCLLSTRLLKRVREESAQPTELVWRMMRSMRAFNPLLGIATMAEFVLTPRGIVSLTRQSQRSLRRQARVMSEIGGEIVEEGRKVVTAPFDRRR